MYSWKTQSSLDHVTGCKKCKCFMQLCYPTHRCNSIWNNLLPDCYGSYHFHSYALTHSLSHTPYSHMRSISEVRGCGTFVFFSDVLIRLHKALLLRMSKQAGWSIHGLRVRSAQMPFTFLSFSVPFLSQTSLPVSQAACRRVCVRLCVWCPPALTQHWVYVCVAVHSTGFQSRPPVPLPF